MSNSQLSKTLTPLMLWGLGVGYVISGMYFGWNLGLAEGGTLGLAIATFFIIIMYVAFTLSYTELSCAIPKAGGAFEYAHRGLGKHFGFIGGMAQNIEFIFAPPAIAAAIGAYLHLLYPDIDVIYFSIGAYFIFTAINIFGVHLAASFELIITVLAVFELLLFAGFTLPHFEFQNLKMNALPFGYEGIFAAIPFAIWFFLAIEGIANVAEETKNPQRSIYLGFGSAIATLVFLCILTFLSAVGVGGWEKVVYPAGSTVASDSPLPLALGQVVSEGHILYKLLIGIGLLGLIASFHGIILAAGRSTFEFGRVGYAPKGLGRVHSKYKTPMNALIVNMCIGIVALFTGKTGEIITIACFGALTLYIISMLSLFALRNNKPELKRSYKVPLYPITPAIALVIATVSLLAMTYYNLVLAGVFLGILGGSYLYFIVFQKEYKTEEIGEIG
ncbi:ethanolamine permease [Flammeovirga aprica]|uniref:Ethanolamine permease n=1 Tax=Flammeovirga aprica JL-4 TaxID=694437 RepID=A0A7X9RRE3_9BACT|nr:ethanolamine permease [Flammeovirga aprica]NME67773.1 ethanolamine permease [Flammeovirga aprica JL-4]